MSSNMNPMLADPSIVIIADNDSTTKSISQHPTTTTTTTTTTTRTSSVHSLDPSNALSKLLDSAIAHAARESTPEVNEFEFDQQKLISTILIMMMMMMMTMTKYLLIQSHLQNKEIIKFILLNIYYLHVMKFNQLMLMINYPINHFGD